MPLSAIRRAEIRRHYRLWRAALEMSQTEVAWRARMTLRYYWEIENGYRQAKPVELKRLARIFHRPTEELREKVAA